MGLAGISCRTRDKNMVKALAIRFVNANPIQEYYLEYPMDRGAW